MLQVEELLESGASLYRAGSEFGPAMKALINESPTADPGPATLRLGQGTWEVILFFLGHTVVIRGIADTCIVTQGRSERR